MSTAERVSTKTDDRIASPLSLPFTLQLGSERGGEGREKRASFVLSSRLFRERCIMRNISLKEPTTGERERDTHGVTSSLNRPPDSYVRPCPSIHPFWPVARRPPKRCPFLLSYVFRIRTGARGMGRTAECVCLSVRPSVRLAITCTTGRLLRRRRRRHLGGCCITNTEEHLFACPLFQVDMAKWFVQAIARGAELRMVARTQFAPS